MVFTLNEIIPIAVASTTLRKGYNDSRKHNFSPNNGGKMSNNDKSSNNDKLDRMLKAMQFAAPAIKAPKEIRELLPVLDQPTLVAPQLMPRVAQAFEEELAALRRERKGI